MKLFQKHNKIGLALGSGGPRGLAHIGVIKALEELKVDFKLIAGASIGSLIGGLYLGMGSIDPVEKMFSELKLTELALSFSDFGLRSGIIKGERLEKYLEKFIDGTNIEDLPLPYAAVATDIHTGELLRITKGNLTKAIRASSSLPGFLDIAHFEGRHLIDGGTVEPVPVETARLLGAEKIIAVNLDGYSFSYTDFDVVRPGATKVGLAAIKLLRYSLALEQCKQADVVIAPPVVEMAWINLTKPKDRAEIIRRGYEATMQKKSELLNL